MCLALEYMNSGTLQTLIDEGKTFSIDDVSVVAFSVLKALAVLHSRRIVHRDVKPPNILVNTDGNIKLTDFGITKELLEDHQAETFIGTMSFMSPARVRGDEYSFEADFWSLGIMLILIITNKHPYPLTNGMWVLMKAILENAQPVMQPSDLIGADLCDFVNKCLNAPLEDATFADVMLQHPFILSAKARGVVSDDVPARFANPAPYLQMQCETPQGQILEIAEIALSWQLERSAHSIDSSFPDSMTHFSDDDITALASQMSVNPEALKAKFREKYDQIDELCKNPWSLEGLRREMWPVAGEMKLADHVCMRAPRSTFVVDTKHAPTNSPAGYSQTSQLVIPEDLGMEVKRDHGPAATTEASDEKTMG